MASIQQFEEILSWKAARKLNLEIGQLIREGKFETNFKLINQIEGSSGSIMDNIAEGFERNGNREFLQFLYIAKGSCGELRSQLYRALDRNYITQEQFNSLASQAFQINSLIQNLINYLKNSSLKGPKFQV